jgi:hypothetical protein
MPETVGVKIKFFNNIAQQKGLSFQQILEKSKCLISNDISLQNVSCGTI